MPKAIEDRHKGALLVRPQAGLCNRLRVLAASAILARESGLRLLLHWVQGDGCWCRFDDLFEPNENIKIVTPKKRSPLPPRLGTEFEWLVRQFPKKWHAEYLSRRYHISRPYRLFTRTDVEALDCCLPTSTDYRSIIIFRNVMPFSPGHWSKTRYQEAISSFNRSLIPIPAIRAKLFDLPPETIGVHIRRGDHHISAAVSTIPHFVAAIAEVLKTRPQAKLFVASDEQVAISQIEAAFPGRVLTRGTVCRERLSVSGVQDALADLLQLSRCSELLGSAYSSFSEWSASLHNIRLRVVGLRENSNETGIQPEPL